MSKSRVYELAKELNKSNKELLDFLKSKEIEVKNHMSSLSDEQVQMVRGAMAGNSTKSEGEDAHKKKNIVQVFRPQNSKQSNRPKQNNKQNQNNNQGNTKQMNNGQNNQRQNNNQGKRQNNNQGGRYQNNNQNGERRNNNQGGKQNNNQNGRQNFNNSQRRDDRRDDNRRNDKRTPSIPAPVLPEQKPQRQKAKDKDAYKKKDYRQDDREDRKVKQTKKGKPAPQPQKPQPKVEQKVEEKITMITIPEVLTIKELADKMKIQPSAIVKKLFMQGQIVTVNQEVDFETAEEIAMEFEVLCEKEEVVDVIEELLKEDEEDEATMEKRPPVVCVMGHVDHGKTSLLDAIRNTNVIDREAGGITQHIGAYVANVNGERITFLDTPGHEAFTAMRLRGAQSTDIAILVVAADDGVMPQTVEAISHAKAAGIEIIVAVNKIDKPSANIERVKQELTEYELIPEDWGGSTIFVPVSAKTGEGLEDLMEMILLTAEVLELKANPNRQARGLVIEAELDKGKGSVATVLVQKGTLRVGDAIAAGSAHGRVRAMIDDKGRRVKESWSFYSGRNSRIK